MNIQENKKTDCVELTIDFGKNMMGITDELIKIGEFIKEISDDNLVYIRDAFIDEIDDVYQFKFVYYPKNEK